ncbi:MAG: LexA family transcriptional regulator [Clostridia bacterium]|nr:LexA family transcriptional regulator [Clostridia bacterium]
MLQSLGTLTAKQKKVYSAIETYIKQNSIPPTVREIGEMIGEKTPGAVQGILNRLEQKGVIKREVGMARSIRLVSEDSLYARPVYIPQIKKINKRNIHDLYNIYNINKYQPVSPDLVNPEEDCFLIVCPDNSLMESGIKYGDMLIISRKCALKNGDVILVMYDGHVLLRKHYLSKNSGSVILRADSNLLGREEFYMHELDIIGRLVCKFTSY